MKEKLLKNGALKIFSLLLAFVLWFLIVQIEDPVETRTFSNIQVKLVNTELLDRQSKVYEVLDDTDNVRVRVRAPRSVFESLRSNDIMAEADVSKLTDINTVPITYYIQNVSVTYDSIEGDHESVKLDVENKKTRWIDLTYNTIGEVAEGYMVYSVTPDQNRIEVTGPESIVNTISYAQTGIDVANAQRDLSANVELELFDENGDVVDQSRLTTNVSYVHMAVEVLATKTVPVEINYSGEPEDGYVVAGDVVCEPQNITIAGRSSAIENVTKVVIPGEKLSIAGATSDVVEVINLKECLPENVRLADSGFNGRVSVTVPVEGIVEKNIEIRAENITITNVPEGVLAELADTSARYTLSLRGRSGEISRALSGNATGTVDVGAWMNANRAEELHSGIYAIPVSVKLAGNVTKMNTIVAQIQITFSEEAEE